MKNCHNSIAIMAILVIFVYEIKTKHHESQNKKGDSFTVKFKTNSQRNQLLFIEGVVYTCTKVIRFTGVDDEIYVGDKWISSDLCIKL